MPARHDILIVDDEPVNLRLLKGVLKGLDLNLISASSGEQALALAAERDFALALVDVMMPGMNGFQVAERLRLDERTRFLPIIFITAVGVEDKYVFQGYETGAVDYLIKPLDTAILRSKVKVFLELFNQKVELEKTGRNLEQALEELTRSQQALADSEERYRIIADYNHDMECWIGADGRMLYVSPSCARITGYEPEKFMADPGFLERIIHTEDVADWRAFMASPQSTGDNSLDFRIYRKDTRMCWISQVKSEVLAGDRGSLGLRCSLRDITQRKQMELKLRHQAMHDPLTGVANRTLCLDRIEQAMNRVKRKKDYHFATMFVDLDKFKTVNDTHGHAFGDRLLGQVSQRMVRCVRNLDTVARFGGDEFVIFLDDLSKKSEVMRVVKRIMQAILEPFYINGIEIRTTVSIGVALNSAVFSGPEEHIQAANIAMYRAKESGRNRFKVFNRGMRDKLISRLTIENDLRRAVSRNEFFVVYQPIVDIENRSLVGLEALARWRHPGKGVLDPGEFIPLAEETGLIVELGLLILEKSCTAMAAWRKAYPQARDLSLSVNISAKQFMKSDLVEDVQRIVSNVGFPANLLRLEITETTVMDDARNSVRKLARLKESGITLSIDDFGTGYSSMSYLRRFPLDHLKIDLSFIQGLDQSADNLEIVRAIINLAHSLDLKVVAEGVEKQAHAAILSDLDCEYGQGFLFARPLSEQDVEAYVKAMQDPARK
ncbi:MAG: EAL domain-containing protein [Desulfovibrionaceae bacterium]|nr:EAL domain-containing protein [Desulfovibrionaceae bacterium]